MILAKQNWYEHHDENSKRLRGCKGFLSLRSHSEIMLSYKSRLTGSWNHANQANRIWLPILSKGQTEALAVPGKLFLLNTALQTLSEYLIFYAVAKFNIKNLLGKE